MAPRRQQSLIVAVLLLLTNSFCSGETSTTRRSERGAVSMRQRGESKKLHIRMASSGAGATKRRLEDEGACPATCFGYSCDHWAQAGWGGFSCAENEAGWGCDCSGCDCPLDIAPSSFPTLSTVPTFTHSPTGIGYYEIVDYDALVDAIESAEEGREWVIKVLSDIDVDQTAFILPNRNIKVVGSDALGRRVRVKGRYNAGFLRGTEEDGLVVLWIENLDMRNFGYYDPIKLYTKSTLTILNCRFGSHIIKIGYIEIYRDIRGYINMY